MAPRKELLNFSATHLFLLDAISLGPDNTALNLEQGLRARLFNFTRALTIQHHSIFESRSLLSALEDILVRTREGILPMIHLDGHAEKAGFRAANCELIPWKIIWTFFRRINVACKNNLCVSIGACEALHAILDSVFSILEPTPIFVFVAPQNKVCEETVDVGFQLFFEELFKTGDVTSAYSQLTLIDDSDQHFWGDFRLVTSQSLFERSAEKYIAEHCAGPGASARYAKLVTDLQAMGVRTRRSRQLLRAKLRGSQSMALRKLHRHFMMTDIYPELEDRMHMNYVRFEHDVRTRIRR